MDYTDYSVEDLASDESFIQWARGGDPASRAFWDDFLVRHPDMQLKIQRARTLVLNLARAEDRQFSDQQVEDIWQGIDSRINARPPSRFVAPKRKRVPSWAIAACATILAIAAVWTFQVTSSSTGLQSAEIESSSPDYIEEVNTSGVVRRIHLSDGSTVMLENNSRLRYRREFAGQDTRVVHLKGEAFFDVAKDPRQPFLVHTDEIVTRVLGTSFRVKEGEGDIVVSVKTGKVSVYAVSGENDEEESQKNAVILTPNQQLTYQRNLETFGKDIVEKPEIVLPSVSEEYFHFEDQPVRDVFEVLKNAYGIEIIFDEELMSRCHFTASLGSEPLFEKLQIICRAIGARYEVIDARVVITSTGC